MGTKLDRKRRTLALIDAVHCYLAAIDDAALARFLENWPSRPSVSREVSANALQVLSWLPLPAARKEDGLHKLAARFNDAAPVLGWGQTYTVEDIGRPFLEKYGWTELIGTRGPVASEVLACGFLLLGPNVEYPLHCHEAEEIYIPLSGEALWKKEDTDWRLRPIGTPVHHAPFTPHAMRTGAEPLLAVYLWRGEDLARKSDFVRGKKKGP
jgi:hypothetical protein